MEYPVSHRAECGARALQEGGFAGNDECQRAVHRTPDTAGHRGIEKAPAFALQALGDPDRSFGPGGGEIDHAFGTTRRNQPPFAEIDQHVCFEIGQACEDQIGGLGGGCGGVRPVRTALHKGIAGNLPPAVHRQVEAFLQKAHGHGCADGTQSDESKRSFGHFLFLTESKR